LQKNAMLRALPDMMFLLSCDGVYLDYHARDPNDLFAPPSSFLGRNMREVFPPDLASRFEEAFAQASDEPVLLEYGLPIKGEVRHGWCDADLTRSSALSVTCLRRSWLTTNWRAHWKTARASNASLRSGSLRRGSRTRSSSR
jgi:hypothetical protein